MLWQGDIVILPGMRLTSLFTSRWAAMAWGLMVIISAIGFVGGWKEGDDSKQQDEVAMQALNSANAAFN